MTEMLPLVTTTTPLIYTGEIVMKGASGPLVFPVKYFITLMQSLRLKTWPQAVIGHVYREIESYKAVWW